MRSETRLLKVTWNQDGVRGARLRENDILELKEVGRAEVSYIPPLRVCEGRGEAARLGATAQ